MNDTEVKLIIRDIDDLFVKLDSLAGDYPEMGHALWVMNDQLDSMRLHLHRMFIS